MREHNYAETLPKLEAAAARLLAASATTKDVASALHISTAYIYAELAVIGAKDCIERDRLITELQQQIADLRVDLAAVRGELTPIKIEFSASP